MRVRETENSPPRNSIRLFSLLKKLVTQAEAFRKAATTGEIDADDAALIGICGDFSTAGERCRATLEVWLEQQARNGGGDKIEDEMEDETRWTRKGKARAIEPSGYSEKEYGVASQALSYESVVLSTDAVGGGKSFLSQ